MTIFKFHGNPDGQLSGVQGDQGFDVDVTPNNYFVCNGGTAWIAFNIAGAESGAWAGVVSQTESVSTTATPASAGGVRFKLAAGDRPNLVDVICADGQVRDLTGCTVKFVFQGPGVSFTADAVVLDAPAGRVQYQFAAGQTAVPGDYQAAWVVISPDSTVVTYPPESFEFQILPALPVALGNFTTLADLYDDVRALTGDFDRQLYEDSAIASVMRTVLRMGKVRDDCTNTQWRLGPDGVSLNPIISEADVQAYSLLTYHSALRLITPNISAYQYRTRAMSERFGDARDFLAEMKNALYELEAGDGVWANITGLRASLFAINGIYVWSYLQASQNIELSYH